MGKIYAVCNVEFVEGDVEPEIEKSYTQKELPVYVDILRLGVKPPNESRPIFIR
jgi:hypothetical protein